MSIKSWRTWPWVRQLICQFPYVGGFVILPIPNVNVLEVSELHMALNSAASSGTLSAVCQGFIGAGIAGEALVLFHDPASPI